MIDYRAVVDDIIEPGCYYADLDDLEYYREKIRAALVEAHKQGLEEAAKACEARAARRAAHSSDFPDGDERRLWLGIKAGEAEACADDIRALVKGES